MSTGRECHVYEKTPGQWFYDLEGNYREEFDTFGPFKNYHRATRHLERNHANPGGYSINALPGCKHERYIDGECEYCGSLERED